MHNILTHRIIIIILLIIPSLIQSFRQEQISTQNSSNNIVIFGNNEKLNNNSKNGILNSTVEDVKKRTIELYLNPYDPLTRVAAKFWYHVFSTKDKNGKPSKIPISAIIATTLTTAASPNQDCFTATVKPSTSENTTTTSEPPHTPTTTVSEIQTISNNMGSTSHLHGETSTLQTTVQESTSIDTDTSGIHENMGPEVVNMSSSLENVITTESLISNSSTTKMPPLLPSWPIDPEENVSTVNPVMDNITTNPEDTNNDNSGGDTSPSNHGESIIETTIHPDNDVNSSSSPTDQFPENNTLSPVVDEMLMVEVEQVSPKPEEQENPDQIPVEQQSPSNGPGDLLHPPPQHFPPPDHQQQPPPQEGQGIGFPGQQGPPPFHPGQQHQQPPSHGMFPEQGHPPPSFPGPGPEQQPPPQQQGSHPPFPGQQGPPPPPFHPDQQQPLPAHGMFPGQDPPPSFPQPQGPDVFPPQHPGGIFPGPGQQQPYPPPGLLNPGIHLPPQGPINGVGQLIPPQQHPPGPPPPQDFGPINNTPPSQGQQGQPPKNPFATVSAKPQQMIHHRDAINTTESPSTLSPPNATVLIDKNNTFLLQNQTKIIASQLLVLPAEEKKKLSTLHRIYAVIHGDNY